MTDRIRIDPRTELEVSRHSDGARVVLRTTEPNGRTCGPGPGAGTTGALIHMRHLVPQSAVDRLMARLRPTLRTTA